MKTTKNKPTSLYPLCVVVIILLLLIIAVMSKALSMQNDDIARHINTILVKSSEADICKGNLTSQRRLSNHYRDQILNRSSDEVAQ